MSATHHCPRCGTEVEAEDPGALRIETIVACEQGGACVYVPLQSVIRAEGSHQSKED